MRPRHRVWTRVAENAQNPGRWPVSPDLWEAQAAAKLPAGPLGFIAGGAGSGSTMRNNSEAFERWKLIPRMLASSTERELTVKICRTQSPVPIGLAPIGLMTIAHPEGELAVGASAEATGVPMIVSSASCHSMEQIAEVMPSTPRWFQLYFVADREIVSSLIRRAEASGHEAIVVTLDTPVLGWRERDLANQRYLPFKNGQGIGNFVSDPVFRSRLRFDPAAEPSKAGAAFIDMFSTPRNLNLSWDDMHWLRSQTKLPLLAKGILAPDDAMRVIDHGFDGLIVSNHGGRQIDGSISALEALIDIRARLGTAPTVLLDGGIRRGSDVIKAFALGADMVFLGRPYMWALAVGGREGVEALLLNLIGDTDRALALCGCKSIEDLNQSFVKLER